MAFKSSSHVSHALQVLRCAIAEARSSSHQAGPWQLLESEYEMRQDQKQDANWSAVVVVREIGAICLRLSHTSWFFRPGAEVASSQPDQSGIQGMLAWNFGRQRMVSKKCHSERFLSLFAHRTCPENSSQSTTSIWLKFPAVPVGHRLLLSVKPLLHSEPPIVARFMLAG